MQKYTIVSFLEALKDNSKFPANNWPLHLTIIDNFRIKLSDALIANLTQACYAHNFFIVKAGKMDSLGKSLDVPVILVNDSAELKLLHNDLADVLIRNGAVFDSPHYIKQGYLPHITVQPSGQVDSGDLIKIDEVSIVTMKPDRDVEMRQVRGTFKLSAA